MHRRITQLIQLQGCLNQLWSGLLLKLLNIWQTFFCDNAAHLFRWHLHCELVFTFLRHKRILSRIEMTFNRIFNPMSFNSFVISFIQLIEMQYSAFQLFISFLFKLDSLFFLNIAQLLCLKIYTLKSNYLPWCNSYRLINGSKLVIFWI